MYTWKNFEQHILVVLYFIFLSSMTSFQEDLDSGYRDEYHLLLFCVIQIIDALQIVFYSQVSFSSCRSLLQWRQVQPVRIYRVFRDIYSSRNKMQRLFLHYNAAMNTICTRLVETPGEMDQFLCILIEDTDSVSLDLAQTRF